MSSEERRPSSGVNELVRLGGIPLAYLDGALAPGIWDAVGWWGCTFPDEAVNARAHTFFLYDCPLMGVSVVDPGDTEWGFVPVACMSPSYFSRSQLLRMRVSHGPWVSESGARLTRDRDVVSRIISAGKEEGM